MQAIECKTPFKIEDRSVRSIQIEELSFVAFANAVSRTQSLLINEDDFKIDLTRARLSQQCRLILDDGSTIQLDEEMIRAMPPRTAISILRNLDPQQIVEGARSRNTKADGINAPAFFKLGSPIIDSELGVIRELEFQANTYGEIEQVLAARNELLRGVALLRHVARLPEHVCNMVSLNDGLAIVETLWPAFKRTATKFADVVGIYARFSASAVGMETLPLNILDHRLAQFCKAHVDDLKRQHRLAGFKV